MAQLMGKGVMPVTGGYLDQSASIIDAIQFAWSEQEHWKAKKGVIDEEL